MQAKICIRKMTSIANISLMSLLSGGRIILFNGNRKLVTAFHNRSTQKLYSNWPGSLKNGPSNHRLFTGHGHLKLYDYSNHHKINHCSTSFDSRKTQSSLFSSTTLGNDSQSSPAYDWNCILPFEKNPHNSIKITVPENESLHGGVDIFNVESFQSKLEATISTAQQLDKTAVWITIPITRARLVEAAHRCGFEFHHATGNAATLSKWILDDVESRIPEYATHQVGVGAVVINPLTDEILCVNEKRNNYRPWKIPGGLVELGEDLDAAAIREVYEETGIRCRFLSILGVRHTHGMQFGRSDLYFVCRMEPIGDTQNLIPQEGEIEATAWIPLVEYRAMVNNPDSQVGHPMMSQMLKIVDQGKWEDYDIQKTIVSSVVPGRKNSPVYHAPIRAQVEKEQGT